MKEVSLVHGDESDFISETDTDYDTCAQNCAANAMCAGTYMLLICFICLQLYDLESPAASLAISL